MSIDRVRKGSYYVPKRSVLDLFTRWDAGSFLEIADHGYRMPPGARPNFPFLPLYPLLVRACSLGGVFNLTLAALVASALALLSACVLLWRLVQEDYGELAASLAVAFLLCGPVGFFFSAPYSEGLFLALSLASFSCARHGRWKKAGVLGALASLTRTAGVMLIPALLVQAFYSARRGNGRCRPSLTTLAACLLPAAGFLSYCLYLGISQGDFLLYFHAEHRYWGRTFAWFWLFLSHESFSGLPAFYQFWFGGALVAAFGLMLAGVLLRIPVAYSVYALALTGLYISSRLAEALPRYLSVVFPFYIVAGILAAKRPRLAAVLIVGCLVMQAASAVLFVNGYWFT